MKKRYIKLMCLSLSLFGVSFLASCSDLIYVVSESSSTVVTSSSSEAPLTYQVTFLNYDGTELFVDTVNAGDEAIYEGETPTKPDYSDWEYIFKGWDKDLKNVQSSFSTTAQYEEKDKYGFGPLH